MDEEIKNTEAKDDHEVRISKATLRANGDTRLKSGVGGKLTAQGITSHTPGSSIVPIGEGTTISIVDEGQFIHHKEGGFSLRAGKGSVSTKGDSLGLTSPWPKDAKKK